MIGKGDPEMQKQNEVKEPKRKVKNPAAGDSPKGKDDLSINKILKEDKRNDSLL